MDNIIMKKEQHAGLCKLLAAEGYDVMLLLIVLGRAGTHFKCLESATKRWTFPTLEVRNYTANSPTEYTVESL
jgi:hypothetical protein